MRDLFGAMSLLLDFLGFTDTTVERAGTVLRVTATWDPQQMSTAAAAIAALAPADLTHAQATINSSSGSTHSWDAPLQPFREYARSPPSAKEVDDVIALARVVSTIRIDGGTVWDGDTWGGVAMLVLNGTKDMPVVERVRRFKEVRDLTSAAGLTEVAGGLTVLLESLRHGRGKHGEVPNPFKRQPVEPTT